MENTSKPVTLDSKLQTMNNAELQKAEAETRENGRGRDIDAIDAYCNAHWAV